MSRCRSCEAPVRWASTENGKYMPVDPEPVDGGNIELVLVADVLTAIVHPAGHVDLFGGPRHVSHFVTCPHAETWRQEHGVPAPMRFDGATIAEDPDAPARLTGQVLRVFDAMHDGEWRTLPELAEVAGGSEAAMSARLRDLRKPRNGGHVVERRLVRRGLYQYRLVLEANAGQMAG